MLLYHEGHRFSMKIGVFFALKNKKGSDFMARGRKPSSPKEMKRANGTGCIRKLSGNRRKPWQVLVTERIYYDKKLQKGVQKTKTLGTYSTKEETTDALEAYNANPYDLLLQCKTFSDVYKEWSERYFEELKNNSGIRTIIAAYKHSEPLHNITFSTISITNMRDTINNADVGPSTKSRMKSLYNLMYDFAVEAQLVPVNLARQFNLKNIQNKIKKEKKDKIPFKQEHIDLLWENIDYEFTKMVLIGIYTGFRPQELCLLQTDQVNIDRKYIIGGMKTEAGTDRYVPIHPKIFELVKSCYEDAIAYNSPTLFFELEKKKPLSLTYDKYRGRFKKVLSYNELEGYSLHCTRHTFITLAKNYGVNEYAIKMICGHEISDITEAVYTHRDKRFLHNEISKIK